MSAIAGRVLIIPRGAYNPSSTYHMLDAVSYNGNSYIAKKTTQGNTPSADNEFWMLLSAGSAVASINDIGDVLITSATDGQVLKYNATTQKWENGEDTGGLLPHLIIISEDGESEVKAVKGSTEIIATRTSAGHYECDVTEFGTWTIHAVLNGDDAVVNLVVDTVKVYTVDDSHFHADITVTYPSGGTCSCSKESETTLYATDSPYTFTVHSAGTWTITATAYGKTFTQTVNVSSTGQTVYISVPDGATVTPTDDIQTLLACAGIGDSEITKLAELFADTTTLSAVINSANAVDYMARSKSFIKSEALVPTMTSDTTPSGVCSASSTNSRLVRPAYMAFDGIVDTSHFWGSQESSTASEEWVSYKFTQSVAIARVEYTGLGFAPNSTVYIESSDDDFETSNLLGTYTTTSAGQDDDTHGSFNVSTVHTCDCVRVRGTKPSGSGGTYALVKEVQFYSEDGFTDNSTAMSYIGLNNYCANTLLADSTWCEAICNSEYFESVLNVKVPVMTSNTTPSGVASASSKYSVTYDAYKAFNGQDSGDANRWSSASGSGSITATISYMFTQSVNIKKVRVVNADNATITIQIKGSDDGVTYTSIGSPQTIGPSGDVSFILNNANSYTYMQGECSGTTIITLYTLQFYGREDV